MERLLHPGAGRLPPDDGTTPDRSDMFVHVRPVRAPDASTLWQAARSAAVLAWTAHRVARRAEDLCG